jgi:hypothetical protein
MKLPNLASETIALRCFIPISGISPFDMPAIPMTILH